MVKKIIFVAGIYGVGKTTLCEKLSNVLKISSYSASDLISKQNNELYGINKYVADSDKNQDILINQVSMIKDNIFILNGHFCLKAPNNNIILLKDDVFKQLSLSVIILIEASPHDVIQNLHTRDQRNYDFNYIERLLMREKNQAIHISKKYNIP